MNIWIEMLKVYAEVVLFKRSPRDTPASILVMALGLGLVLILSVMQLSIAQALTWQQYGFMLLDMLLLAMFFYLVLYLLGRVQDWLQMFTVWLMFVFYLNLLLVASMLLVLGLKALIAGAGTVFMILTIGLSLWSIVFMIYLFASFFTPVVWQAVLIYLLWILLHFGLVMGYQYFF